MLTSEEREWLQKRHPHLSVNSKGISGVIEFTATYNKENRRFLVLHKESFDSVGGRRLTGRFEIHVQERTDKTLSKLPALHVDDVETSADRHFSQSDKTACLCSPLEEDEFLQPEFRFKPFLEELVIPFLYGQLFYSLEGRWPWQELAHGATGLLEAYFRTGDPTKAEECLQKLTHDKRAWPRIRQALEQKSYIKGHTPCFCQKEDHIRRCHPDALKGAQKLREDINAQRLAIPSENGVATPNNPQGRNRVNGIDKRIEAFNRRLENYSEEELRNISEREHKKTERDFELFKSAFVQGQCCFCGHPLSYFADHEPCLHWLLAPKGFRKRHFPLLYRKKSFHEIEAYLRWVANSDKPFRNINDLVEEKRPSKLIEMTIRYKDLEWSFSCSESDFSGHKDKREGQMPHYHFQMKQNNNVVINYGGFHILFHDYDQFVFAMKRDEFEKLRYGHTRGAGMQTLLESMTSEELLEGMKTAGENTGDEQFHLSTFVEAEPGSTISGDEIAALAEESRKTGEPLAKLVRRLKNVKATTIISPGPAVPEIAARKPRRSN